MTEPDETVSTGNSTDHSSPDHASFC